MMDYNARKCVMCGKLFIPASEHIYKRGRIWLCGWNCTCAFDKDPKMKGVPKNGTYKRIHY